MRAHRGDVFGKVSRGDGRDAEIVESLGRLDLDNVKGETEETGAEALWFGEVAARAKKTARDLRLAYDVTRARAANEARLNFNAKGERYTVDQVKEAVDLHEKVQRAFAAWSDAEYQADLAESAKFTLARKHEHLQHLSGLLNQELLARRAGPYAYNLPEAGGVRRQPVP